MKIFKKLTLILSMCLFLGGINTSFTSQAEPLVQNFGEELVIVIDPGHGGENLGTIENGFEEKTMTLVTAKAMYEELIQYDNVMVFMTRTDDKDLSLKERAEFAASVDADFLFSLHYNASENHTHFGSEIWIPHEPPFNAYGYQFGYRFLEEMEDMGLFLRGIKTRLGDKGDYYGVIRESVALSVPAVILEHCHVDEARDIPYCETEAEWKEFGRRDALAVAKYFGLSSQSLGVDYSAQSLTLPSANAATVVQSTIRDETAPDICMIELINTDYETGEALLTVTATDYDSPIIYYDYSLDGGETYCAPIAWPGVDLLKEQYSDTFTCSIQLPEGVQPEIILRAYNLADLYLESNSISILQEFWSKDTYDVTNKEQDNSVTETDMTNAVTDSSNQPKRHSAGTLTFTPAMSETTETEEEVSFFAFLKLCLIIAVLVFFVVLVSQSINYRRRRKRRRQRIKELENSRNHRR